MQATHYKSRIGVWLPFSLRRIDCYFMRSYLKAFFLILAAVGALVAIGDMFQRFDDFVMLSRREDQDLTTMVILFLRYYATFVPQLIFQYMFPVIMLLAASITATSSYAGPRGNNEYIVIRSAGIPVLRAFFPLIAPALLVALTFQAGRDFFLPDMVRESQTILNRLRQRVSNPTSVTILGSEGMQTAVIGWFSPDAVAYNLILEIRDPEKFRRGDPQQGDNNFVAYRAASASLEPAPGGGYHWVPGEKARLQTFSRFSRRDTVWTDPIPTSLTPAMIERQTLGDAVSSWRDLLFMREDNASVKFELHWRLADPLACCILIIWGTGVCMGRMLRGSSATYIHAVSVSMAAAALFYILRLAGKSLWEAGMLTPEHGVWLPIAAGAVVALPIMLWMER